MIKKYEADLKNVHKQFYFYSESMSSKTLSNYAN